MKFKFCSDGDCPLWALAALHALGSLPAALFKTLLHHIMEEQPDDGIMEILKDTNLSSREECARAAAVVRWVIRQACACSCSGTQLTRDLLVLGVPRAHAAALGRAADDHRTEYEARVRGNGSMISKLTEVSVSPGPEGTLDTYKLILHSDDVLTGDQKKRELIIEKSQASTLLEELKKAYKKMEEIENE